MLFNKNDGRVNDRIIYQTKPNMILGCKKVIFGIVILGIILVVSPNVISFIGDMQVYLISHIKLPLTRYTAIAFFVIILINVIYIIWQLVGWYSMEYTLTETKIIVKSGVLSTKKNYMPYTTIQDVNTSQGFLSKLINVGSVSIFSAYDNNQMELKNISNPSEVEEIIFSRMVGPGSLHRSPQSFPRQPDYDRNYPMDEEYLARNDYYDRNYPMDEEYLARNDYYDRNYPMDEEYLSRNYYYDRNYPMDEEYLSRNDYYDEYEPITPITHEREYSQKRSHGSYPEDISMNETQRHKYEYEPYNNGFKNSSNNQSQSNYYNQVRDDYSNTNDNHYQNNEARNYYNEEHEDYSQNDEGKEDEDVIRRHFDKFK